MGNLGAALCTAARATVGGAVFKSCLWLNPPDVWSVEDESLRVRTVAGSDFWRETYYGFTRDSGHCFALEVVGDFTAQLLVRANFRELYDQAGLLLRIDESHWLKAGAEYSDGQTLLGSVLTDGSSDWATGTLADCSKGFWMRLGLSNGVARVQYSLDGEQWPMLRLARFPVAERYMIGAYCCTPEREGLEVVFSEFKVSKPLGRALHDLR
ncbi:MULTISPECIES: DUF1349 domain-containing protein [Paraburkholderia]|uniref:DUF1349 domain-containing protein n=1 Tax=Paraburkholderia TaxID=1822464 RepID=UPI002AB2CFBC|nr:MULTISPECIES: DUF1349 domain-containing protein [Paraburkholderia]